MKHVAAALGLSVRALASAKQSGRISARLFAEIASRLKYDEGEKLLSALSRPPVRMARGESFELKDPLVMIPTESAPQRASLLELPPLPSERWQLACRIRTDSPYFRFGVKLLPASGHVFGDGSILSHGPTLLLHIGRNDWTRRDIGVTRAHVFFACYSGVSRIERKDRPLFRADSQLDIALLLSLAPNRLLTLRVNDRDVYTYQAPAEAVHRAAVLAWGDDQDFVVTVSSLAVT
jgi:hypothetical protein